MTVLFSVWVSHLSGAKRYKLLYKHLDFLGYVSNKKDKVISNLNPWLQSGCRVQDIGFAVESKNLSFTCWLNGYFRTNAGSRAGAKYHDGATDSGLS